MLSELYIENIAIIEQASIELHHGFHVFSGETGAGKSIVIDSINMILGAKTSKDLIRTGAQKGVVSAKFTDVSNEALCKLEELGFALEADEDLILYRDLSVNGRSNCKVNGRPATVSILREIGSLLINIHGQHDSQALMQPEHHLDFLDEFADLHASVAEYRLVYESMQKLKNKLQSLQMDEAQKARQIDLLRFQIDEIEQADLQLGEEEELSQQRSVIRNAEKIRENLELAFECLTGAEEMQGAVDLIKQTADALSACGQYLEEFTPISERLTEIYYETDEFSSEIRSQLENNDYNPDSLNEIESRLDLIYRLKRKYGSSVEEILSYLEKVQNQLDEIEFSEEAVDRLNQEFTQTLTEAEKLAKNISAKRKAAAQTFAEAVKSELSFLDMPKVRFEVRVETAGLSSRGMDAVSFCISTNPGEPPKPLSKIASGGELSRIMLAMKSVISGKDAVDTLIFDEIDTGVSGRAAQKIGIKLRQVAKDNQVICITHLAQIAVLANHHYLIEKHSDDIHTYTNVTMLDEQGRIEEVSRIVGGAQITDLTRETVKEMIRQAQNL